MLNQTLCSIVASIRIVKTRGFFTDALVTSLTPLRELALCQWLKVQQIFLNYHSMKLLQ